LQPACAAASQAACPADFDIRLSFQLFPTIVSRVNPAIGDLAGRKREMPAQPLVADRALG
jgi:hypothetical protein